MKTRLTIVGAAGRMGRRITALAVESGQFEIVAAIENVACAEIGNDAGLVAGIAPLNVALGGFWPVESDVAIDFSLPQAADETLKQCTANGIALVMGTTGLSDQQHDAIKAAARKIPIVYGTNMSVGMNVLFALVGKAAAMLGDEYDIEIIEQHHRFKKDAPSGSALTLAENICKATGRDGPASLVHGRSGKEALRPPETSPAYTPSSTARSARPSPSTTPPTAATPSSEAPSAPPSGSPLRNPASTPSPTSWELNKHLGKRRKPRKYCVQSPMQNPPLPITGPANPPPAAITGAGDLLRIAPAGRRGPESHRVVQHSHAYRQRQRRKSQRDPFCPCPAVAGRRDA